MELDRKSMPKQISALNTFWLVQYLRENYPEITAENILSEIPSKRPYYVENLKTGKIENIFVAHLLDTENSFGRSSNGTTNCSQTNC